MSEPSPQQRRLRWLVWSLTGIYGACLLVATHLPPSQVPRVRITDKILHFGTYVVLAMLGLWSAQFIRSVRASAGWVVLAVMLFGAMDELTQPLVGRIASINDWLSDAAGGITGVAAVLFVAALLDLRRGRFPRRRITSR